MPSAKCRQVYSEISTNCVRIELNDELFVSAQHPNVAAGAVTTYYRHISEEYDDSQELFHNIFNNILISDRHDVRSRADHGTGHRRCGTAEG
jgi:hypothetical protein